MLCLKRIPAAEVTSVNSIAPDGRAEFVDSVALCGGTDSGVGGAGTFGTGTAGGEETDTDGGSGGFGGAWVQETTSDTARIIVERNDRRMRGAALWSLLINLCTRRHRRGRLARREPQIHDHRTGTNQE